MIGNPRFPVAPAGMEGLGGNAPKPSPDVNIRPRPRKGLALTQGDGETGFPHPPTRWEGVTLPGTTCFHPVGVRRSRMDG
jgi:hypothetical protein